MTLRTNYWQNAVKAGRAVRAGGLSAGSARPASPGFAYLDVPASAAAHGYSRAREKAAGEREQRRGRLLTLLLSDPTAPSEAVREQAARAGRPLRGGSR